MGCVRALGSKLHQGLSPAHFALQDREQCSKRPTRTMDRELLPRVLHARLARENDGVRLYGGIEPGERGQPDFRQAWLCAPTPARAREILPAMLQRQGGEV
jgi:hypothetical protein